MLPNHVLIQRMPSLVVKAPETPSMIWVPSLNELKCNDFFAIGSYLVTHPPEEPIQIFPPPSSLRKKLSKSRSIFFIRGGPLSFSGCDGSKGSRSNIPF